VKNNATKFWGILLFLVGVVFLLSNYAVIPETVSKLWPVVLLGVGLRLFSAKPERVDRS
jgi:hypothetical protein